MFKFTVNHIAISVKDVVKSIEFYQKVFQLKEIKNTASNSKTRWLVFNDNRQLHLIPRPNEVVKTNKAVHFAISTKDIQAFINHLITLEIEYGDWLGTVQKDYVRNDGIIQVYFQDPNGYWIEVNNDLR
ncbi:VOC family protein [Polaribacter sp.]|uniref:VOC family protein n=1 Tax=Polaribacter sp. TaxID=1920175 RepID=UPI003F6BF83F